MEPFWPETQDGRPFLRVVDDLAGPEPAARANADETLRSMGAAAIRPMVELLSPFLASEGLPKEPPPPSPIYLHERDAVTRLLVALLVALLILVTTYSLPLVTAMLLAAASGYLTYVALRVSQRVDSHIQTYLAQRAEQTQRRVEAAERWIRSLEDPRFVAPLSARFALFIEGTADRPLPPAVEETLLRLIPRIQPDNAFLLSPADRRRIYAILSMYNALIYPELMICVIRMAARLGDVTALDQIAALVSSPVAFPDGFRVRRAAEEAVEALRRADIRRQESCSGPDSPDATLLRPAPYGATDTEPLLRPSNGG